VREEDAIHRDEASTRSDAHAILGEEGGVLAREA